jgi:hypothetical protein
MSALTVVLGVGVSGGVVIGTVASIVGNQPLMALLQARRRFQKTLRERFPALRVSTFGAMALYLRNPRHPDVWIKTSTDEEKERLIQEPTLFDQFRELLVQCGYPTYDVPFVRFIVESQQTVDRQFGGNWGQRQYVWLRTND